MPTMNEKREVAGFTAVALRGYGELTVEQNADRAGAESLEVEADARLLPRLASRVKGRRLVLGLSMPWYEWFSFWFAWVFMADRSVRWRLRLNRVEELAISGAGSVNADRLRTEDLRLKISGSGKVRIDDLGADSLATSISGSGRIVLGGAARRHEVRISGSGAVDARRLDTRETAVRVSGSGSVAVNAVDSLEVRISGNGEVSYLGQPAISQSISGTGRIRQAR